jgi:hypothetical protein
MAIITRQGKGSALTHSEMDNNFLELETSPSGKIFPKDSGVGILVDVDTPTFPWHDMPGQIQIVSSAANPASNDLYIGGIYAIAFEEGDEAFVNYHIPHDYLPGSPIYIHAHWSHKSSVVTGGSVTIGYELSYSKGHNQGAFSSPINVSIASTASTTQYRHIIAEGVASSSGGSMTTLDTDLLEPDGVILSRIYVDSNDLVTSDLSIPKIFIHYSDIHYQSTGLGTKNRSPSFWGA